MTKKVAPARDNLTADEKRLADLFAGLDELTEDEAAIIAELEELITTKVLDEPVPAALPAKHFPRTERQRLWDEKVAQCEELEARAASDKAKSDAAPGDRGLNHRARISREVAKSAREAVERGQKTHQANYEAAHGATPEERRVGWSNAYRERILKTEGRVTRVNQKPSAMMPEQRREYERERERQKKARQREAKKTRAGI